MKKRLLSLVGVQELTTGEKKSIKGGSEPNNNLQCDAWNSVGLKTYVECRAYFPLEINWTGGVCNVFGPPCGS
ncbi:hypothetical protein RT99_03250 [Flavobacterium sp. MEB061]|uniref:hypothetical protein n=1 Tax=Flavobacterium sp. MEB061 TaxID=1587524 RepID=UPI0005AC973E|nr:hypothetical protein [Flavobacterium sp. MEB061]KIQ24112.1 hypothetical protein RT99_03250 [Flavobacterium sp. MEB061]